jgi:hypothetical protein
MKSRKQGYRNRITLDRDAMIIDRICGPHFTESWREERSVRR